MASTLQLSLFPGYCGDTPMQHEMLERLFQDRQTPDGELVIENFRRWFGYSKVVDQVDGAPLQVFHTTRRDFTEFKPGGFDRTLSGAAMWFSPDPNRCVSAHNAVQGRDSVQTMPVFLRIERPLVIDEVTAEWARALWGDNFPQLIGSRTLQEVREEYDGVLYHHNGMLEELVVFDADQIKSSIANVGYFARGNADITDRNLLDRDAYLAWKARQWVGHSGGSTVDVHPGGVRV